MKKINVPALVILIGLLIISGCGDKSADIEKMRIEGRQALDAGDFNKAINIFKEALKYSPSDRDFLFDLAMSFRKFELYDSAYTYFRRAKVLNIHDREINKQIIEMAPMFGDFEDAINAIAVMVATGDNEKMYWPRLAELYYRNQDMFMTAKYCKLILADDPELKDYYLYLSGALSQMGKFEESSKTLLDAMDRFGPSSEACANIAVNYLAVKNLEKAEEYFRKSLEVNPENIPIWINLANVLSEQDNRTKKEEGLEIYKKFYEQTPPAYKLDSLIPALEAELSN